MSLVAQQNLSSPQNLSVVAQRLGFVALGFVLWKYAGQLLWDGLLPLHPVAIAFLYLLFLISFSCIAVAALGRERYRPWSLWLPLVVALVAYSYRDWMRKVDSGTMPTTDAHLFLEIAARKLLAGKNPYAESMLEAYRSFHLPLSYSTPLASGDITDKVAYPALSFLALVPVVVAHVPTYVVYAASLIATVVLLLRMAPSPLRPVLLAFCLYDDTLMAFSFNGGTDALWMLLVVLAIRAWPRYGAASILIGLACAVKQHPWFLLPFLVARCSIETMTPPWRGEPRMFALRVGAIFALFNLPFLLVSPRTWFACVLEPLRAPMITLSEGFSTMSMTGYVVIPKEVYGILSLLVLVFFLFAYVRHFRTLREVAWFAPAIALWFGHRALMSYWYYFGVIFLAAVLQPAAPIEDRPTAARSWRPTWIAGATLVAATLLLVIGCALRPPPFVLSIEGPFEVWDQRVLRMRVHVVNRMNEEVHPRISVQYGSLQPLQWIVEDGPPVLGAGESATFQVRAPSPYNEFDVVRGARVTVSDSGNTWHKAAVTVPGDRTLLSADAIPNPDFRFVENRTGLPMAWSSVVGGKGARLELPTNLGAPARVRMVFDERISTPPADPFRAKVAACVRTQALPDAPGGASSSAAFAGGVSEQAHAEQTHWLRTLVQLPSHPLRLAVRIPVQANAPPWETLYGLRMAVPNWKGYVLFGDRAESGTLPDGSPFLVVASGSREQWSTIEVDVADSLRKMGAPLVEQRFRLWRFSNVDIPMIPLEIGPYARVPAAGVHAFEFGAFFQDLAPAGFVAPHPLYDPSALVAWHGSLSLERGNPSRAADLLGRAVAVSPTEERLLDLATSLLWERRPADAAAKYGQARDLRESSRAVRGLGWAQLGLGEFDAAVVHFERALVLAEREDREGTPDFELADTLRGLTVALAERGDCARAAETLARLRRELIGAYVPPLTHCPELR